MQTRVSHRLSALPQGLACVGLLLWVVASVLWLSSGAARSPNVVYRWNDDQCKGRAAYACRRGTDLELFPEQLNWYDARASCRAIGGDLASIHSDSDLSQIHRDADELPPKIWIGLSDRNYECGDDGSCFRWSDGSDLVFTACVLQTNVLGA